MTAADNYLQGEKQRCQQSGNSMGVDHRVDGGEMPPLFEIEEQRGPMFCPYSCLWRKRPVARAPCVGVADFKLGAGRGTRQIMFPRVHGPPFREGAQIICKGYTRAPGATARQRAWRNVFFPIHTAFRKILSFSKLFTAIDVFYRSIY